MTMIIVSDFSPVTGSILDPLWMYFDSLDSLTVSCLEYSALIFTLGSSYLGVGTTGIFNSG